MNILVATPGRLLQHMDQTIGFDCDNLQMLGMSTFVFHIVHILNAFQSWMKRIES